VKTDTYPLTVPPDLLGEVRQASRDLGLSVADIMRQIIATIHRVNGWL
jgi:hypothetical protein